MHLPKRTIVGATLLATALFASSCGSSTETATSTTAAPSTADVASLPAVPSAGCANATTGAVTEERREVPIPDPDTGANRWFLLTTPPVANGAEPMPLVLDFHGLTEGATIHAAHSALSGFAVDNGFAVAFPNGTGTPIRWNALPAEGANLDGEADLAYVDAVLDQIEATQCIDTSRVYATGLSNGAGMTSLLACVRGDRFAAAAPVAGLRSPTECDAGTTTPVLAFHGTVDPILYYNGGIGDLGALLAGNGSLSAPEAVIDGEGYPAAARAWATHNGCAPEPAKERIGTDVEHWTFDCPAGNDVEFYAVVGGGHTWPGSEFSKNIAAIAGPTTDTVSANDVMWAFFRQHRLA
jgi:polyhydroxybutyrate depolymerase